MFRWLAVCLILCVATVAVMSLALGKSGSLYGWIHAETPENPNDNFPKDAVSVVGPPPLIFDTKEREGADRILVLYEGHIRAIDKQDVPSEREGRIMFIGTELPNQPVPGVDTERKIQEGKLIPGLMHYLATQVDNNQGAEEKGYQFFDKPGQWFRVMKKLTYPLQPGRLHVASIGSYYKKLEVGDRVQKGDLVALVNPEIALHDMTNKVNNFAKAEADRVASEKTWIEAGKRVERLDKARGGVGGRGIGVVSEDDYFQAVLTRDRYEYEEKAKREALHQAQSELDAALSVVRMHEVRAQISGKIKTIYKNRGDGLKSMDPVLQIQNEDQLRVDGTIGVADTQHLQVGMVVSVEPTHPEAPWMTLRGHTREITCVAVSKGPKAMIVSGSEDRSIRVWDPLTGREYFSVTNRHTAPRSVACSNGPQSKMNLALVGWADGTAQVFNLDALDQKEMTKLGEQPHQSAVASVAFSPDGTVALTAGEDRSIKVWKVSLEGKKPVVSLLHTLKAAHKSPISCVQFIPVDFAAGSPIYDFYSVSDNVLQVWEMKNELPPVRMQGFDHRKGDVAVLGNDGKRVLFDENGELRLHSLTDVNKVEGRLRNPPGTSAFTNVALFSPDGKTILTNVAAEGRLQLWRTPQPQGRGSELRQFVRPTSTTTGGNLCAAFAPENSLIVEGRRVGFVVTGQDQEIQIWRMPETEEIESRLTARIVRVERALENSSQQVPVWAELESHPSWLSAGVHATMVIDLNQKIPAK